MTEQGVGKQSVEQSNISSLAEALYSVERGILVLRKHDYMNVISAVFGIDRFVEDGMPTKYFIGNIEVVCTLKDEIEFKRGTSLYL